MPATEVLAVINAINATGNAQLQQDADQQEEDKKTSEAKKASEARMEEASRQVSLDMAVDGQPAGQVVLRLFQEPPVGSQRFLELARRKAGGYRLSKVDGISDSFVTVTGVLQLNYAGMAELPGGETVEQLEAEQTLYTQSHDRAGLVSLIVKDATPRDVRDKIVAYNGKFIEVQEVRGASNANGTGFAITLGACPLLDQTNLVVGEVVEGLDVVQKIAQLPKVKSSSQSPFFKVAKILGDRRADVAARSFGKPFGKVIVQTVTVGGA